MVTQAPSGLASEKLHPPCPLPLPEHSLSSGFARGLVLVAPMIESARQRVLSGALGLAKSYPDAPFNPAGIEQSLAANLAQPLLQMMSRVLVLELNVARLEDVLAGDTPQERFGSFLGTLRQREVADQLLSEYQVLTRLISDRLEHWVTFSLEFLRHVCEDWSALRPWFGGGSPGPIVKVQVGAGDTHRGGRSVMIALLAAGERVVYKPRSLAADEHFQQLLAWLSQCGVQPDFRLLRILDRGDHGWSEFVSAAPCATVAELSRFYRRQGSYLALLHALGACDFHCENLIAAGEHPVLIDLEALFHPRVGHPSPDHAEQAAVAFLASSAIRVGLLPLRLWANEEQSGVDMSGLSSTAGQLSHEPVPQWHRVDTDEMHIIRKRVELPGFANCPTLTGQPVNALDHADAITAGFTSTYRLLLADRAELLSVVRRFAHDRVRVIVRATQTYASLYRESFHPDVLRDDADRGALFDCLREAVSQRPELERLVAAERSDLLRGDIPLFTTSPASCDVWTSTNERIDGYFAESGMSLVERRISELSEKDLVRQLWVVRASLATLASHTDGPSFELPHPHLSTQAVPSPQQLISAAARIGDRLAKLAITADDEATWIGLEIAGQKQWCVSPLGADLYDGLPGVILFLAYLGLLSGDPCHSALAKAALKTLRRQTESFRAAGVIGGFSGWGGIVYLLAHLGVIWADRSLFSEAEELLDSIHGLVERDAILDVIGGVAGCALTLLSLQRCKPSVRTLETARACGEHLLRTAQPASHGMAWLCGHNATSMLTGFAHGNAGIAYALFALAEATRETRFQQGAVQALEYERSFYSPEQRNWRDLRNRAPGGFATAWCHGAPGIGLSRLCSLGHWNDSIMSEEIDAALATTRSQGLGNNHALCHGDLGNADIMLHASVILHDDRWRADAGLITAAAMANANEAGWVCANPLGVESPGLMTGLAGIGYALLRLADPKRVPSVLALQCPVLL
jgi:type 2 lantibiotic biosynthesis protein LanM